MNYVELPCHRLEPGKPVPFHVWDARGNLLIRKGDTVRSVQHQEQLAAHRACVTEGDFKAWQRSYDRLVYRMFREGATLDQLARTYMPSEILEVDYMASYDIVGGWLDMHEVMSAVLYQGPAARNPLERIDGVQRRAMQLIDANTDDCLYALFQAMPDRTLGYCAKHALLAAVLCELTARKLQMPDWQRPVLFRAALTQNIAMAKEQDALTRQNTAPTPEQQRLIQEHAGLGAGILRGFGVVDEDWLSIVADHHAVDTLAGTDPNLEAKRILRTADTFIARVSARATREALPTRNALRFMIGSPSAPVARVGAAMSAAVGFYPPGSYVTLANGEVAVAVRRGETATTPTVVSFMNAKGLALGSYVARDTRDKAFAVLAPVAAERLKFKLNNEKILRALGRPLTAP